MSSKPEAMVLVGLGELIGSPVICTKSIAIFSRPVSNTEAIIESLDKNFHESMMVPKRQGIGCLGSKQITLIYVFIPTISSYPSLLALKQEKISFMSSIPP